MKVSVAGGALLLSLLLGAKASADPPLWRVDGPHATVYLVGSAPQMPADGRWRTPALEAAAREAQEIWLLAPLGLPGPFTAIRMLTTIQTQGQLPDGERLSTLLSADGRQRLARLAAKYGVSLDKLDRMTPWNAQITLSLAARKRDGGIRGEPIERYVLAAAPHAPRKAFDNLETDLKLLISVPRKEQIYNLEDAMRRYEDPSFNERYGEAWEAGDLAWVYKERDERLRENAPVTYETLQVEPRRRWSDQIANLARGSKTVVVILEAQNFVGPEGLPALLRKKGLEVKGP